MDASDVGMGGFLSQTVDGKERIIAYHSKTFSKTERNYSTVDREFLAAVTTIEHFQHLLLGKKFTLRTDQQSLVSISQQTSYKRMTQMIARWKLQIDMYTFTVVHIPGRKNTHADMLSRLELEKPAPSITMLVRDDASMIIAGLNIDESPLSEIHQKSARDEEHNTLRNYIHNGWPEKKSLSPGLKSFYRQKLALSETNGLLFLGERLIIPKESQKDILKQLHSGHPGVSRALELYSDAYFWPGATERIKEFVKDCRSCSETGKNAKTLIPPMKPIPKPTEPWKKLAIDICGPFANALKHQR
ncbi:MAG: hypothetical protein GY799_13190, partial [Desulfobulbaceae bacterium]|nr:hypothetical protein [Desulfobulbaceae bacterium]